MYDGLGSVVAAVDSTEAVTPGRKYHVYASVRALTGQSGTKHKFVGSLGHPSEDETGPVYMRARYYDPVVGRFTSEDPTRDGENWFSYAENRATSASDRSGLAVSLDLVVNGAEELRNKITLFAQAKVAERLGRSVVQRAVFQHGLKMYLFLMSHPDAMMVVDEAGLELAVTLTAGGLSIKNPFDTEVFIDFKDLFGHTGGKPHVDFKALGEKTIRSRIRQYGLWTR